MGWKDAPVIDAATPSWMDAPIVGGPDDAPIDVEFMGSKGAAQNEMQRPKWTPPSKADLAKTAEADQIAEDRMTLSKTPQALQAVSQFNKGIPFVGEYLDEAADLVSPGAGQLMRDTNAAFARQNPKTATGLNMAGGVVGSVPLAAAAAPTLSANAAGTLGARAMQAGVAGAVAGGAEGAISGAGRSEGAGRLSNATMGGLFGAGAGGALGAAAPYVAEGVKNALTRLKGSPIAAIKKQLGVSDDAARVIKNALDTGDIRKASDALDRAGAGAMLADAGQPARELLDAAANSGGKAGMIVGDAVGDRATIASRDMQKALDTFLGKPVGQETAKGAIRSGTQAARSSAYDAAYSVPIDYSKGRGVALERIMKRVPQSAIKRANELMRLQGEESAQIIAKVADDGAVAFERLPDVRQLDYITRALNDVADQADGAGKMGGTTALGRATKDLSANIRKLLRGAVPEYARALDTAADAISQVKATELGYDLLKSSTRRETVRTALNGASKAEKDAAKQGLRDYIDDALSRVSSTLTDNDTEAREGIKLLRDISSRSSTDKIRTLLGPKAARQLATEIDKQAVAFELRAALAANSKTAIRQSISGTIEDATSSGTLELIASGKPQLATQRFVQIFTGNSAEAQALRQQGIYEEIATALTNIRGTRAQSALNMVQKAIDGKKVSEQQAAFIGNVVASSGVLAGSREASTRLSTQ